MSPLKKSRNISNNLIDDDNDDDDDDDDGGDDDDNDDKDDDDDDDVTIPLPSSSFIPSTSHTPRLGTTVVKA